MHQKLSEFPLQCPEAAGIYLLKINNRNRTVRENMFQFFCCWYQSFWKYLFLTCEKGKEEELESSQPFFSNYTNSIDRIVIRSIKNYSSITCKLICLLDFKSFSQLISKISETGQDLRFVSKYALCFLFRKLFGLLFMICLKSCKIYVTQNGKGDTCDYFTFKCILLTAYYKNQKNKKIGRPHCFFSSTNY